MKKIYSVVFSFLLSLLSFSQSTVSTTVYYTGFQACGGCTVCGMDYWCFNTNPSYCGPTGPCGTKTFFDPVPAGNLVTNIQVQYFSAECSGGIWRRRTRRGTPGGPCKLGVDRCDPRHRASRVVRPDPTLACLRPGWLSPRLASAVGPARFLDRSRRSPHPSVSSISPLAVRAGWMGDLLAAHRDLRRFSNHQPLVNIGRDPCPIQL